LLHFPKVGVLLDESLHFFTQLHTETVCEAIHEVEQASNEHDIDDLLLGEAGLAESVDIFLAD